MKKLRNHAQNNQIEQQQKKHKNKISKFGNEMYKRHILLHKNYHLFLMTSNEQKRQTLFLSIINNHHLSGADPRFSWGEAQTIVCALAHHERESQCPLPGSFWVLDALSSYLSLIFKHSNANLGTKKKNRIQSKLRGR